MSNKDLEIYEIPFITKYMRRVKCLSYVPILPTFDKELHCSSCRRHNKDNKKSKFVYENDLALVEESNQSSAKQTPIPNGRETKDNSTRM